MKRPRQRPEDYTIGWICALPIELAAAEEMLDEQHENLYFEGGNSYYTLGRIGVHSVVLACLPAGRIGPQSAAIVITHMTAKFTSIRFSLMVGVGGGVPSAENDVRLGDVVISQPHMQHGGVVQYDFGKSLVNGKFQRTNSLDAPPAVLLHALARLRASHYRSKGQFFNYLSAFDRLPQFDKAAAGPDLLFEADYNHFGGPTCAQCDHQRVVERPAREGNMVPVHYGNIASGNQVIKDGVTRDRISTELGGVLSFEMEAAGLMNSFPCLVVRGISDYADSHKNKKWQPYAAAAAAACAKEILSNCPALEVREMKPIGETSGSSGESAHLHPRATFYGIFARIERR